MASELPRGTYLLRFEPAAVTTPPPELTRCVGQALQRAGQAGPTP
jgi:hypothetical protein